MRPMSIHDERGFGMDRPYHRTDDALVRDVLVRRPHPGIRHDRCELLKEVLAKCGFLANVGGNTFMGTKPHSPYPPVFTQMEMSAAVALNLVTIEYGYSEEHDRKYIDKYWAIRVARYKSLTLEEKKQLAKKKARKTRHRV